MPDRNPNVDRQHGHDDQHGADYVRPRHVQVKKQNGTDRCRQRLKGIHQAKGGGINVLERVISQLERNQGSDDQNPQPADPNNREVRNMWLARMNGQQCQTGKQQAPARYHHRWHPVSPEHLLWNQRVGGHPNGRHNPPEKDQRGYRQVVHPPVGCNDKDPDKGDDGTDDFNPARRYVPESRQVGNDKERAHKLQHRRNRGIPILHRHEVTKLYRHQSKEAIGKDYPGIMQIMEDLQRTVPLKLADNEQDYPGRDHPRLGQPHRGNAGADIKEGLGKQPRNPPKGAGHDNHDRPQDFFICHNIPLSNLGFPQVSF